MSDLVFCASCGMPVDRAARYCRHCGAHRLDAPAPQAPPPTSGTRAWVAIAAGAAAFALAASVIATLILTSKGNSIHAATVLTVTTPAAPVPSSVTPADSTSTASSTPRSATDTPSNASVAASMVSYRGARMSAQIPAGWTTTENEVPKPGYVESRWTNPASSADYLLIDMSPATHLTPEQDAASVHRGTKETRGYEEISYGPGDLFGVGSWMWVFRVPASERIDYFFERCTNTFGVLGSTTPSRFGRLRTTFRAVAQSVQPVCR
jgi:hypothetical protein